MAEKRAAEKAARDALKAEQAAEEGDEATKE
jgi:hypothetical protein